MLSPALEAVRRFQRDKVAAGTRAIWPAMGLSTFANFNFPSASAFPADVPNSHPLERNHDRRSPQPCRRLTSRRAHGKRLANESRRNRLSERRSRVVRACRDALHVRFWRIVPKNRLGICVQWTPGGFAIVYNRIYYIHSLDCVSMLTTQEQFGGGFACGAPATLGIRLKSFLLNEIGGGASREACHLLPNSATEFRVRCRALTRSQSAACR